MADKIQWAGNTMPKSDDKHLGIMSLDHVKKARAFHQSFPQYTVTPLARLDGQAAPFARHSKTGAPFDMTARKADQDRAAAELGGGAGCADGRLFGGQSFPPG